MDERELINCLVTAEAELIRLRLELAAERDLARVLRLQLRVARATRPRLTVPGPVLPIPRPAFRPKENR